MHMKANTLKFALALGLAFSAAGAQAASYHASISIDPAVYAGGLATPLSLDFQLNSGGGASPASNTVTISGFAFSGAGPTGSASVSGDASGDLSSAVTLSTSAANPFNELFQGFANGATTISFNIDTTANANPAAPDWLAVALLDGSAGNPQIPTAAPDTLSLITLALGNPAQAAAYAGTGAASGVSASVAAVPLPAAAWLLGSALAAMGVFGRRRAG
jgi:hypothetical protein